MIRITHIQQIYRSENICPLKSQHRAKFCVGKIGCSISKLRNNKPFREKSEATILNQKHHPPKRAQFCTVSSRRHLPMVCRVLQMSSAIWHSLQSIFCHSVACYFYIGFGKLRYFPWQRRQCVERECRGHKKSRGPLKMVLTIAVVAAVFAVIVVVVVCLF